MNWSTMTLLVRASSPNVRVIAEAVRRTLQKVDPLLPISGQAGEDHADPQLGAVRLTAEMSMRWESSR